MSNDELTGNAPQGAPAPKKSGLAARMADKFLHGKGIFTFLRSTVSSQLASWIDMGVCFVLYAFVFLPLGDSPMRSFVSTAIGLVAGGVVNCIVNYRFTFRADNCSIKAVAVKYLLIRAGSFVLNLVGTTLFDQLLQSLEIQKYLSWVKPDGIFAFARLSVSLVVSLAWNFILQKNFVYRPTAFDPYAIGLIDWFSPSKHKHKNTASTNECNQGQKCL